MSGHDGGASRQICLSKTGAHPLHAATATRQARCRLPHAPRTTCWRCMRACHLDMIAWVATHIGMLWKPSSDRPNTDPIVNERQFLTQTQLQYHKGNDIGQSFCLTVQCTSNRLHRRPHAPASLRVRSARRVATALPS